MNPSYLSYFFKEQTGENFIDYLNKVRIEKAKELLKDSSMSLSEIASQVGYSNAGYFNRIFKKIVGITPGQYRNRFDQVADVKIKCL